jgi:hypothetical protein
VWADDVRPYGSAIGPTQSGVCDAPEKEGNKVALKALDKQAAELAPGHWAFSRQR